MANRVVQKTAEVSGMDYRNYLEMTSTEIKIVDTEIMTLTEKEAFETKKLNMHRMSRIDKSYIPCAEIVEEISKIEDKQVWVVITENWCGDSAQNLPYIAKIASLNKSIKFRIVLRDSNPEIMDMYLTNGTRSIPKLVVFDEEGNEIFQWGSRPKAAQQLINDLKGRGIEKKAFIEKLHLWYAKNGGKDIEAKILDLIKNSNLIKNSV